MNPSTSSTVALLNETLAHHRALSGDQAAHHDRYGAAPAYEAGFRALGMAVDAFRPDAEAAFARWAEPLFGTDEEARKLAREAFAVSQFGRALAGLGAEPSSSGYVSKVNVLLGKFKELEAMRATVATVNSKL